MASHDRWTNRPRYTAPASQVIAQIRNAREWFKSMFGSGEYIPIYHCTVCGADGLGDRPDCPRDGVHCNIVERMMEPVNPEWVKRQLDKIRAKATDDEVAHSLEDDLHMAVLRAIGNGSCVDPKTCAALAYESKDIKFSRWYA